MSAGDPGVVGLVKAMDAEGDTLATCVICGASDAGGLAFSLKPGRTFDMSEHSRRGNRRRNIAGRRRARPRLSRRLCRRPSEEGGRPTEFDARPLGKSPRGPQELEPPRRRPHPGETARGGLPDRNHTREKRRRR